MAPKEVKYTLEVNRFNPYGIIKNSEKRFVLIEDRKNREINLGDWPNKLTLEQLVGWDQESSDWIKEEKKKDPNHRRNRAANKRARISRRRNQKNNR